MNLVSPCMTPSGTVLLFSCRGKLKKNGSGNPPAQVNLWTRILPHPKECKMSNCRSKKKVFKLLLMIEVYHTTEIQTPVFISDFFTDFPVVCLPAPL